MGWKDLIITLVVLAVGYVIGTLRPTGLLARAGPKLSRSAWFGSASKAALILAAIGASWTFGYLGIWSRLQIDLDGTITARQDVPQNPTTHGPTTVYTVRQSDGSSRQYVATPADASLPQTLAVGAHIVKRPWELSYTLDGQRIDDFPIRTALVVLAGGLACLIAALFLLYRERQTTGRQGA